MNQGPSSIGACFESEFSGSRLGFWVVGFSSSLLAFDPDFVEVSGFELSSLLPLDPGFADRFVVVFSSLLPLDSVYF
jgi:hypothetical protein